jgi:3-hydroxyacyl-[acyl-carrier-protein] dehydratase
MKMRSAIGIAADHPAFAGHFPHFPVLPGAILLDEMLHAIAGARGLDLTQWRVAAVKFLDTVRPRDRLIMEHDTAADESIRFTMSVEDRRVASGTLSRAKRDVTP